ncbi:MAG: TMEM175 family protein, partial [Nocardioidaceae bacterium]
MRTSRLEAFSAGVLAIVITVMVLELKVPDAPTFRALAGSATGFVTYALSFVYVGIYWNNHHHMFQLIDRVGGGVLWPKPAPAVLALALPVHHRLARRAAVRAGADDGLRHQPA